MKIPHFFKAKSRLGLINPPMRHEEINIGVEDAPDNILTADFLNKFPGSEVAEFIFSKPEIIAAKNYYHILATELKEFADLINNKLKLNQTQVVVGGDNSVTFSSLLALINRTENINSIGYLQFDSHGEMHLHSTSISKNFHGMYMRPFFDKFDVEEIESLVPNKLNINQVLTVGDMIFEENHPKGEQAFHKNITNIHRKKYLNNKAICLLEIQAFLSKFDHIHVNFDIDVFNADSVGPSGMGNEGVWLWEDTLPIIKLLRNKQNLSLDIVEVNPRIPGAERTVKTAQVIISQIIK